MRAPGAPEAAAGQMTPEPPAMAADGMEAAPLQVAVREADQKALAEDALKELAAPGPGQWAPVRKFPLPDYSKPYEGPRVDFRETILWEPSLRTDQQGRGELSFYLSDAVTSFRATAQGVASSGGLGIGDTLIASKLPVSLAAKLPLEVSRGDEVQLPLTLTNNTKRSLSGELRVKLGAAFKLQGTVPKTVRLAAGREQTLYVPLAIVGDGRKDSDGVIEVSIKASNAQDAVRRTVRVVPPGFPGQVARSGSLSKQAKLRISLPKTVAGSKMAELAFYPSPSTQLIAGTEALIAEPSGCFEQASSTNYPNVMVLGYLRQQKAAAPDVEARALAMLDRGYDKLAGYESKTKGYEWFGADPGHEALTAYGVMQFSDMAKVFPKVDKKMLGRTVSWLKARRDGKGGYRRSAKALDSFGRASPEVTNAYITYALTEAGEKDLAKELGWLEAEAQRTKDPYVLALAAGGLANARPGSGPSNKALRRLAGMQAADGHYPGAKESITMSGGQALEIETASLATSALMKAKRGSYDKQIKKGLDWIGKQGKGGRFGSTQSTVLALKVLTKAAGQSTELPKGTIAVTVNGGKPQRVGIGSDRNTTLTLSALGTALRQGDNEVVVDASADMKGLPYGLTVDYRTESPPSSPQTAVSITATPTRTRIKNGEPLPVRVTIANQRAKGIPMVIARIGIPGGLTYQTKQLDQLRDRGTIDYYETRPREVIVYLRSMAPKHRRTFTVQLLATVPGKYTAPASSAYLYYTDEHRHYQSPFVVEVRK